MKRGIGFVAQVLLNVAFAAALFALMDWSIPINVRLVSGGVLSPMGEDPAIFYRRYRSHLKVRVLAAIPLCLVVGVLPHLPVPQPLQIAGVTVSVVTYGVLIGYHMVLARTR
jgi:hypothetical protein